MAAMRYMIRQATPEQLSGVVVCLAAAFEPYRSLYTPGAFTDTVPDVGAMSERIKTMTILCASDNAGQIVGTIACGVSSPGEGHLRGMAVLPEFQGRGLAGVLLSAAENNLRQRGCVHVTLDTTRPLLRAVSFYTRRGYAHTGIVTDFFGMALYEYDKQL
jgi:GNAT superfamily N-acetyltransferase